MNRLTLPAYTMRPNRFRRPPIAPEAPPLLVAVAFALVGIYSAALALLLL